MLLRHIEWVGDDIQLEFYDTDGSHQTIKMIAPDLLDLRDWITHNYERLYEIVRRYNRGLLERAES